MTSMPELQTQFPVIHCQALDNMCHMSIHWTGLLDWVTGLTFELKLCVPHDLHLIRCAELGHMFDTQRYRLP